MKVLFIIDYGTVGGATHSFLEMVSALKDKSVTPFVCTSKRDYINNYLDSIGIDNFAIGHKTVLSPLSTSGIKGKLRWIKCCLDYYISNYMSLRKLESSLNLAEIDLIHTNSARNDIGCFISKKYGIPHVMHIREFADSDFDCISFRPNYINVFNNFTTKFISISDAVKKHWIKKGIPDKNVITIYNGIHYEDISVSSDDKKCASKLHMLIAGGVVPAKGQQIAIEAIRLLPEKLRQNVTLDIAGWGIESFIKILKNHVVDNGLTNQIHFLGSINDVHERMGRYQIGLMCSRAEGFGRVTAEYMHGRLGVIASDSGANPELIDDGVTGLLFKSGDAKSLADCIMKFYNDRELLVKLSNAAQKKARALYTQQKNAEAIYELYKDILNKQK